MPALQWRHCSTLGNGAAVRVEAGGLPWGTLCPGDLEMQFYNSSGVLLAWDDDDSINTVCPLLGSLDPVMNNLPAGTYYVRMFRHFDVATVPPYTVLETITP